MRVSSPERSRILGGLLQTRRATLGSFDFAAGGDALVAEQRDTLDLWPVIAALGESNDLDLARPGKAALVVHLLARWNRPPKYEQLADVLDCGCVEVVRQRRKQIVPKGAIVREYAHLDQAMCAQRKIKFLADRAGHSFRSDHHDRIEMVGCGPMFLALRWREFYGWHLSIIDRP